MRCGCGGGAKQTKIRSKQRLGAVLVQGCGLISKQGLGAWFLCWVSAGARVRAWCFVLVQGVGAMCKQRLGVWCCAKCNGRVQG